MNKAPLIVLLTDFSKASYKAFKPTLELATRLNGRLALLHVVQELVAIPHGAPLAPPISMPSEGFDALMKKARTEMDKAQAQLGAENTISADVLSGMHVHDVVTKYADEHNAAMIALSTHGRSGFRRVIMGSVAEAILRRSKVPVIIYPSNA